MNRAPHAGTSNEAPYLATCRDCRPIITRRFPHPDDRAAWAADHILVTGHTVDYGGGAAMPHQ